MDEIRTPHEKKYFSQLPHIIFDKDLTPMEFKLWCYYNRVGNCWQSVRSTAEGAGMSVGSVSASRKGLASKNLIECKENQHGGLTIIVQDLWPENMLRYCSKNEHVQKERSENEQERSENEPKNNTLNNKENTSLSNSENLAIEEDLLTKPYTELEEMCKQLKDKGYIVVVNYWWQLTGKQVPQLQKGGGKTSFATKFAKHYKAYVKENPRFLKEIWSVLREFHFNVLPIKPESRKTWLNIEFILGPGKAGKSPGWLRLADKESFFYFAENGTPNKPDVQVAYYTP
ncbi:MAG: hypothetical protein WBC34_09550 [Thiofilum sp.]